MSGITYEELRKIQADREQKEATQKKATASSASSSSSSVVRKTTITPSSSVSNNPNTQRLITPYEKISPIRTYVKPTVTASNTKKSSYLDDGYDFGDITKTILRTSVETTSSVANKTSNAISSAFSKIGSNSYSAFDNSLIQKYSSMSLSQIEKELERVEKEEKLFKETNGGKFYNYISKAGASINVGADASGTAMTAREQAEANIDTLNDYTREKEILGMLRKQKAIEEHLGDLSKEQLQMLDNIADAEASEDIAPIYFASNPDVNQSAYYDAIKPEKAAAEKARATLLEQFKVKNPGMSDEELNEIIDDLVELRRNQKNAEEKAAQDAELQALASEHPISAFFLSRGANIFGGFAGLSELFLQRDNEYGIDTNAPGFAFTNASNTIDEQVQLDHDWEIGGVDAFDLFYEAGTGIVDNVARLAVSGGNTAVAGAMMFPQITTQSIIEGKKKGYSDSKALAFGLLNGTFEAVSEKLSLDAVLGSKGGVLKKLAKSFAAEGSEEVTSSWLNRIADQVANGNHSELSKKYEELLSKGYSKSQALAETVLFAVGEDTKAFVMGGIAGAVLGGGNIAVNAVSNVRQKNAPIELDEKSQQVVDKVVEARIEQEKQDGNKVTKSTEKKIRNEVIRDLQNGYLDKDSIYSEFGGEDYENYKYLKNLTDENIANGKKVIENLKNEKKRLQAEYDVLYKMKNGEKTDEQKDRQNTLKEQIAEIDGRIEKTESIVKNLGNDKRLTELKDKLDANVSEIVKDSKLSETFLEGDRRGQSFVADLTKYDVKQRKVVKKAIESGILNNSNRTHEFVDMVARISADKGVSFDFTNNEKLKASGFAVEGKIVNGYKTDDGSITINIQAKKSLNSVVGHEIAHILEGTELYAELENAIKAYATTKGEYDTRLQDLRELYEGVYEGEDFDEKIRAELVADIVGDYLFTDYDFVRSLTANKNLFQKLRDEVKYFCKIATAGSQEAKELEKVKRNFDRAYQEGAKSDAKVEGTKNSLSEDIDNSWENNYNYDTHYGENLKDTPAYLKPSSDIEWQVFCRSFANKTSNIVLEERNITIFTAADQYLVRADGYMSGRIISKTSVDLYNESGDFYDNYSRSDVPDSYDERKGNRQGINSNGNEPFENEGADSFYVELDKFIENHPEFFRHIREISSDYRRQIDSDKIAPINEASSKDGVFFDGEKTKFSLSDDSDGRALSEGQKEYFSNSKIVDANGSLKVMYHGSHESFTVFDKKKARSSGTYGKGFYFTDSKTHAATYGNSYDVYLNITNPLQDGTNDITKDQLRKFVEAIAENEDYGIENYGYGATVDSVTDSIYGKSDFGMLLDLNVSCIGNMVEAVELFNKVNGTDYDGIVAPTETVAFYPNQIKKVDNTTPSADPDIRYSLSEDDLYTRANQMQLEVNKLTKSIEEFEKSDDFKIQTDKLTKAIDSGNVTEGIEAYNQWQEESGYKALFDKRDSLRDELGKLRKKAQEEYLDNEIKKEKEAIAKSGLSEADYFRKQAVKEFGYTPYFYDAGYITADGKMLNFSGEKGKHFGSRGQDHRAIGIIYADTKGTDALNRFLNDGNIRIMAESPGIDVSTIAEPTKEQYSTIRQFINRYSDKEFFSVDFTDESGKVIGSLTYENRINPTRILNDIKHFYATNEIREPADFEKFRFSLSEVGESPQQYGNFNTYAKDVTLQKGIAPTAEAQPVAEDVATEQTAPIQESVSPLMDETPIEQPVAESVAPMVEEPAAEVKTPTVPEVETPGATAQEEVAPASEDLTPQQTDAAPDVEPYIKKAAEKMLVDLKNSDRGYAHYDIEAKYRGEDKLTYVGRRTSPEITELLDMGYDFADIEGGLNAITGVDTRYGKAVNDIKPILERMLREGYTDFISGEAVQPDQDYLNLFAPMQGSVTPTIEENVAPVAPESSVVPEASVAPEAEASAGSGYDPSTDHIYQLYYAIFDEMDDEAESPATPVQDDVAPLKETAQPEMPKTEAPKVAQSAPKVETPKATAPKATAPKAESFDAPVKETDTATEQDTSITDAEKLRLTLAASPRFIRYAEKAYASLDAKKSELRETFEANKAKSAYSVEELEADYNRIVKQMEEATKRHIDGFLDKLVRDSWTRRSEEKILGDSQIGTKAPVKKDNKLVSDFARNFISKDSVFETLALKKKNRALEDKLKLWRSRSGAMSEYFMKNGNGDVPSLKSIVDKVKKAGLSDEFDLYLKHRHNVSRANFDKPIFGYDVTSDMSLKTAAKLQKQHPEFKEWANDVYKYNDHLLQMCVDGGIITPEAANELSKKYPNYVPIERIFDEDFVDENIQDDSDSVFVGSPIKTATGGESATENVLKTMAHRTGQVFSAVNKNAFGVELMKTLGGSAESAGTNTADVLNGLAEMDEGLLQPGKGGKKPTFSAFVNGKRATFEITDEMFKALQPTSEAMSREIKPLSKPSAWHKKVLTEYNLFFTARNFPKDAQEVFFNSRHAARTYANMPVALGELLTGKGKYLNEYYENGGKSVTYFEGRENDFIKDKNAAQHVLGFIPDKISAINEFVESLPRLAEFIASRKSGATVEASMLDAARVTTDFSDGGDITKFLNRNGATFLNASVQGAAQHVRNFRQAKAEGVTAVMKLVGKYALSGLPVLLFNSLMWDDDDDYQDLSEYVKDNYYVVAKYGDRQFVRIPKGRTAAVIQEATEQVANLMSNEDTDWDDIKTSIEAVGESFFTNLAPNNPFTDNVIAPLKQAYDDKAWYGESIVPANLKDVDAREQFDESTDSISKWLGEKTGISPYKINYVLNQYSGFVGDIFLPMLTPEAERGDSSVMGNLLAPLKDQFVVDGVIKNRNPSDFYILKDELNGKAVSKNAKAEDKVKYEYIRSVSNDMGELYNERREIQNSDLPDDIKFKQVREVQDKINQMAKDALETYENVEVDGNFATANGIPYKYVAEDDRWYTLYDNEIEEMNAATEILGITPGEYWSDKDYYKMAALNPEKLAILEENGISTKEYFDEIADLRYYYDDDYAWAANNPDRYVASKFVSSMSTSDFRGMLSELWSIEGDPDGKGGTVYGTQKTNREAYIWSLDIPDVEKYVLHKWQYPYEDDYNDIVLDYIDSRSDISWEQKKLLLEEMEFLVGDDGYVSW